ncbi:PREDICTED: melatonin receptor type 1B-B-like [Acropora digitifera]|uniref:melatonin receptor type 1B-B-like n=1 Tax=Acropora digitifera TaxID=70779 RepID=UPI00077A8E85|nr:PREDICTED: melatonin receptor type 1B-B-like [Acropora digitifera]
MNVENNSWTTATVVVAAILVCIVIFIGILGNLMVLLVTIKGNRVRTKGRAFIASLAIADAFASTNLIFMLVSAVSYGKWVFGGTLCQLNGFLTSQFAASSTYSLQAISVNRYFIVVKENLYGSVFTARNQLLIVALIWCIPIPLAIGPVLGWSHFEFQVGNCLCLHDFRSSISYSMAVVLVTVLLPLLVMCLCYFQIFKRVTHHSNQVDTMMNNAQTLNVQEVKITKTLFVVISVYVVCFVPAVIVNLLKIVIPTFKIPLWIDILFTILVFSNHANNPIIYGALNEQYRKAFMDIFRNSVGFGDSANDPVLAGNRVLPRQVVNTTRQEGGLGTSRDTGVERLAKSTTRRSTIV